MKEKTDKTPTKEGVIFLPLVRPVLYSQEENTQKKVVQGASYFLRG